MTRRVYRIHWTWIIKSRNESMIDIDDLIPCMIDMNDKWRIFLNQPAGGSLPGIRSLLGGPI